MKTYLASGASILALSMLATGASAQNLSDVLGTDFIDLVGEYESGAYLNFSINDETVDGSIDINQDNTANNFTQRRQIDGSLDLDITTLDIEASSQANLDILASDAAASAGPGGIADATFGELDLEASESQNLDVLYGNLALGVELEADFSTVVTEEITKVNLGEVASTAIGAINSGPIEIGQEGDSEEASGSVSFGLSIGELALNPNAAANANAGGATATYTADLYVADSSLDFMGDQSFHSSSYGPANDVFAANFAYNESAIDGSISIVGSGMSAAGISSTAIGAANSGGIFAGFQNPANTSTTTNVNTTTTTINNNITTTVTDTISTVTN